MQMQGETPGVAPAGDGLGAAGFISPVSAASGLGSNAKTTVGIAHIRSAEHLLH